MRLQVYSFIMLFIVCAISCSQPTREKPLRLWYDTSATEWTEALPVGNGRLAGMVHGGVQQEHIQFNEETLWTGGPHDYAHEGASEYLDQIRQLLFEGKQKEAEDLAMKEFMSVPLGQKAYQPFGDVFIDFKDHENYSNYHRELDLSEAICKISYEVNGTNFTREVLASNPDQLIVIHLEADHDKALSFELWMDALHENKLTTVRDGLLELEVAVNDGVMKGMAKVSVESDGDVHYDSSRIKVDGATKASIYLSATTNFVTYKEVAQQPSDKVDLYLDQIKGKSYETIRQYHVADYRRLFDRFAINLGGEGRDSLPIGQRIRDFQIVEDPQLVSLYVQYARYLMIASSRPGTHPTNLQGIWNNKLKPPWDSKYTVNINTEMNYWPAEPTNLSECHEPLFQLIEECAQSGKSTAQKHYNARGWILHHNTDQWRGTAPINHANHGIWAGGSGWLSSHLWEHYLYTLDLEFLRNRAYPIMREAALFYVDFLIEDPKTGWLISSPSNSPENGGLVAGPTMDHQIIRSLFKACIEASAILGIDEDFSLELQGIVPKIAPNMIGKHGQLMEWLEDRDDPENKHRHVSHLWGMHPGKDINWEDSPELMKAARQSLLYRGDDGTGWSLAWKINFWARFRDGNHAYELIKMLFRLVESSEGGYKKGGSYLNLFDAHPPFQIDGNFGAAAGIVEMLMQSHLTHIELLPALPDVFASGSLKGVCARGGFELDFHWEENKLKNVVVRSKVGGICRLKYGEKTIDFETVAGEGYALDGGLILQ